MTRHDRLKKYLPLFVLLTAPILVYSGTFDHEFIPNWDDYPYVLENEAVRGLTLSHLKSAFGSWFVGNYAPAQIISYMTDYALWGLNPAGYLLGNILLHTLSGILFYLLLTRLAYPPAAAFVAAFLFLCHPLQVESVAWISQRKNVLAMLFFLLALRLYLTYRDKTPGGALHYLLSLAALALALLSKSVAVIFPLVVLLYDHCFPRGARRTVGLADKIPYLILALVVAVLALASQDQHAGGGRRGYPGGSPLAALFSMLPVLPAYIGDCFLPTGLSPFYSISIRQAPDAVVIASLAFALLLVVIGVVLWRRDRRLFFSYALFFIGLLPVSQIVPLIPLKNDRYLYFPLLGFAGLVGGLLAQLWQSFPRRRTMLAALAALLLAPLPFLSHRQAAIWKNDVTLWNHAVKLDPENQVAWLLLSKGQTLRGNGSAASEALEHYLAIKEKQGPPRGWEHE